MASGLFKPTEIKMKNLPKKIYLQSEEPIDDFNELSEVTWCADKINENDIEYTLSVVDIAQVGEEAELNESQFREHIANELTRYELIDRFCEVTMSYRHLREQYLSLQPAAVSEEEREFERMKSAWAPKDVVSELVRANDILLHEKDYGGHGWEGIEYCWRIAKDWLQSLNQKGEGKKRICTCPRCALMFSPDLPPNPEGGTGDET